MTVAVSEKNDKFECRTKIYDHSVTVGLLSLKGEQCRSKRLEAWKTRLFINP